MVSEFQSFETFYEHPFLRRALQAAQAAAAAASQINAKLGIQSSGQASSPDSADLFGVPGMGPQTSETLYVPDRMVGLCKYRRNWRGHILPPVLCSALRWTRFVSDVAVMMSV